MTGTMRVHYADKSKDYEPGEVYFWAAGHNLEAVTDTEYLEVTRSSDYDDLMHHCQTVMSQASLAAADAGPK